MCPIVSSLSPGCNLPLYSALLVTWFSFILNCRAPIGFFGDLLFSYFRIVGRQSALLVTCFSLIWNCQAPIGIIGELLFSFLELTGANRLCW
jgi:hypothetical protein